jgi:hypothetical protein
MDMDGFGSRVLKRSTYLTYIYREPVMFTGFKLFYKNDNWNNSKMYTPEELLHSHQNQATFNFNNFRLMKIISPVCSSDFVMAGCQSKSKETPATTRSKYLENKVVNKIIATKKPTMRHHSFKKEVPILCYHNIKDFDSSVAHD